MPLSSRSGSRVPVWIAAGVFALAVTAVGADVALGEIGQAYMPTSEVSKPGAYAAMPQPETKGMSPQQVATVQRGEYLTTAADCMPCHQAPGAKPFAGGLSFMTPFGTMYSPNITPNKTNGIGNWTNQQFWHALHNGVSPGSSLVVFPKYIYPAMPYTSYSKLSKPDVLAIKAYLDAIPAVDAPPVPNKLNFPFNIRAVLLGWRVLFFRAAPVHFQKDWSPAVRNGAYIAEALGHCSECHSPRNLLFATKSGETLAGAQILGEPWYAPNISSSKRYGVGGWSQANLVSYLYKGGNMVNGSAFGPMKSVVDYSLSQLPESDVSDLAAYLQTATKPRDNAPKRKAVPATEMAEGHALYTANCAACHQADGKGIPAVFPNLAGNQAVTGGPADNTIGIVLGGMIPWHANGPAMPAFGSSLSDQQIAAVTNYVRTAWGNQGVPDATAALTYRFRKAAPPHEIALADADYLDLPPIASAAARKLGCPLLTDKLVAPDDATMQIMAGATPDTLANRTRMLMAAVKKANPAVTADQMSQYLLTAYCPVVATEPGLSLDEKKAALKRFMDQAQQEASVTPAKQGS
jgi:mono/diheme cytochrome c family protein